MNALGGYNGHDGSEPAEKLTVNQLMFVYLILINFIFEKIVYFSVDEFDTETGKPISELFFINLILYAQEVLSNFM